MSNFTTYKTEIKGKKYIGQFNGIEAALEAQDENYLDENPSVTSMMKTAEYIFEHVIVEPKLSVDDFGAENIGKEEKTVIDGKEYTATFKGLSVALEAIDSTYIDGTSNTSSKKLTEYLLKKVITSPKGLKVSDFANTKELNKVLAFARKVMQGGEAMKEFNEVLAFGREVMNGNFQEENESGTKSKGTK